MQHKSRKQHNITTTNSSAYQVRITRNKVEYSLSFSWARLGKRKAFSEALRWRDKMLAKLPPSARAKGMYRTVPASNKKTKEPVGVTRYINNDLRSSALRKYLRYSVLWHDERGAVRNKSFQAGNVELLTPAEIRHAAQTAKAFRKNWEWCHSRGLRFDPSVYDGWKDKRLYPFRPPSSNHAEKTTRREGGVPR